MSIFFILALIAIVIVISTLVYNDRPGFALSSLAVLAVAYNIWIEHNAYLNWWTYIQGNWVKIIIFFIIYMVVGVLWSFFQFKRLVRKSKEEGRNRDYASPKRNFDKITNWMIFWVFSVPLYFLTVPIQDLAKWIYRQFGGVYDSILNKIYGDPETHDSFGKPLPTPEELKAAAEKQDAEDKAAADRNPHSDFAKRYYAKKAAETKE